MAIDVAKMCIQIIVSIEDEDIFTKMFVNL